MALISLGGFLIAVLALGAALLLAVLPPHRLLRFSLTMVPLWLTLGQLKSLGTVADAAKAGTMLAFLLVIAAVIRLPGRVPRRGPMVWAHLYLAVAAVPFVMFTPDNRNALAIRATWVLLCAAAALVAIHATSSERALTRGVVQPLLLGAGLAVLISASALIIDPAASFSQGTGRFFPWGASPNQVGTLYALHAPLALWMATRSATTKRWRYWYLGTAAIAFGALVIGVPRGLLILTAISCVPLLFKLAKRPVLALIAITLLGLGVVAAVDQVVDYGADLRFDRLTDTSDNRFSIQADYLADEIGQRPILGLLGTSALPSERSEDVGRSTHSAYLSMLYLGGITLTLPMLTVSYYGLTSGIWALRRSGWDALTLWMLLTQYAAIHLHGFVSPIAYHPTYVIAFWNIFLCCGFIALRHRSRRREATTPAELPTRSGRKHSAPTRGWGTSPAPTRSGAT